MREDLTCNLPIPTLAFQAVVYPSDQGGKGAQFPSGCHSVFPDASEPGHGPDAAPAPEPHQERACEPRAEIRAGNKTDGV